MKTVGRIGAETVFYYLSLEFPDASSLSYLELPYPLSLYSASRLVEYNLFGNVCFAMPKPKVLSRKRPPGKAKKPRMPVRGPARCGSTYVRKNGVKVVYSGGRYERGTRLSGKSLERQQVVDKLKGELVKAKAELSKLKDTGTSAPQTELDKFGYPKPKHNMADAKFTGGQL